MNVSKMSLQSHNSIRELMLRPNASIREALTIIDAHSIKMVLVVQEDDRLIATVTDGDIRRGLLHGIQLGEPLATVMHLQPKVARHHEDLMPYLQEMKENRYRYLPVVDESERVIAIRYLADVILSNKRENPVVIMAGGRGERLRPFTETVPKPMIDIQGQPMLFHVLNQLKRHGFYRIYLSVNYKKEIIQNFCGDGKQFDLDIRYIEETQPLGTAGSLGLIEERFEVPLIVMNADLITKMDFNFMLDFHCTYRHAATMCVREYCEAIPFGVVRVSQHHVQDIVEKPIYRHLVSAGIYILEPKTLSAIPKNNYLDMPSFLTNLIRHGESVGAFTLYEDWLDVGRVEDQQLARQLNYAES